jgi:hypothetical protein
VGFAARDVAAVVFLLTFDKACALAFGSAGDEVARAFRLAGDEIAGALRPSVLRTTCRLRECRHRNQQSCSSKRELKRFHISSPDRFVSGH